MHKQLVYEWRGRGLVRGLSAGLYVGVVGFLLLLSMRANNPSRLMPTTITGIVLASLGFVALLVIATVLAVDSNGRLFKKPSAYFTLLTPTKGWQILGSRVLITVVDYTVVLILGMLANVAVSMNFYGQGAVDISVRLPNASDVMTVLVVATNLLRYILLFYFARTMIHSVYARIGAKTLLGILTFIAANWMWSAMDWYLGIDGNSAVAVAQYAVLAVVRLAALFIPTAYLLEKKMNL
jgi:hypothetical protein